MHKSWSEIGGMIVGVLQWTIAIGSVLGTLALFTWIAAMFLKKDR